MAVVVGDLDGQTLIVPVAVEEAERLGAIATVRVVVEEEVTEARDERDAVFVVVLDEEEDGLAVTERDGTLVLVRTPEAVLVGEGRALPDCEALAVVVFVAKILRVGQEDADAEREARVEPVEVVDPLVVLEPVEDRVELEVAEEDAVALVLGLVVAEALADRVDDTELVVVRVLVPVLELVVDAVAVLVGATVIVPKLVAEDVLEGFTLRVAKFVAMDETDATELTLGFIVGTELRVEVDVLVAVRLLVAVNVGSNTSLSKFRP